MYYYNAMQVIQLKFLVTHAEKSEPDDLQYNGHSLIQPMATHTSGYSMCHITITGIGYN